MTYTIETEQLVKHYGETKALDGIDLHVAEGTVLGVLGPNGAGKTTAVRVLATLIKPDSGVARVCGIDVVKQPDRVRQLIGLTGQYASVDEDLTGRENLVLIGQLMDLTRKDARARAAELLEQFGLTEAGDRLAKTYSGGMRRRLDLGASLVGRPQVIFLDEPTTGLDPAKRDDVWQMVRKLSDEGTTVLLTTQYLDEAEALAHELSVIDKGRVIAEGTPNELKQRIGEQTLEVRPVDPSRLPEVSAMLAEISGRTVESPSRGQLSAAVDSDDALTALVARLGTAGIAVTELALRLPSLDEVFVALTGHRATTDEEEVAA
ncbi:MAG: ATP-binding cassette domain-containing protein [bacterium]|nr:ATP-binding cassette domain-containing protein [bacterium]